MAVVTTSGDKGSSVLRCGTKLRKDHPSFELLGDLDELVSLLGVLKCRIALRRDRNAIERIQKDIMQLCGAVVLGTHGRSRKKNAQHICDTAWLEKECCQRERQGPSGPSGFVLPGKNEESALCDVCRAVARRAERRCVTFFRGRKSVPAHALTYMNRLSDMLYLLARSMDAPRRPR